MKNLLMLAGLLFLILLFGCDLEGEEPQLPNPLKFELINAAFDGNEISPLPNYTLSISYDDEGNITSYSAINSGLFTPTPSNSGTVSVTGDLATFTAGSDSRDVTISAGNLNQTASNVTLQWELTKVDDGVQAEQAGTYIFVMEAAQ